MTILTFGLSVGYDSKDAEAKAEKVLQSQAAQMLGNREISENIGNILDNHQESEGKWWKTLLSFVAIVLGATGVVAALQNAMNLVWEVTPDPETTGIWDFAVKRVLSLGMILGLGFLLLASLVVSSVLSAAGEQIGGLVGMSEVAVIAVNFFIQTVVVLVVFAAIFKLMPDAEIRWTDVAVGASLTTVLFLIGRSILQIYFSYSNPGAQLGTAAASLAVLLVWVYYTAMIVLLGAEATQVYAVRYGNGIQPERGAVRVVRELKRKPTSS